MIKVYIVTYKKNDVLNQNLKTLWEATKYPGNIEVKIISNHPSTVVYDENKRDNLKIIQNTTRMPHAWGYLSRDWNFAILDAFKTWKNPEKTEWCVLAQNDVTWVKNWDEWLLENKKYDIVSQPRGDQSIALNIEAVRKIGFFDECLTTLHFHEIDYFIRAIAALEDRVSINDDHGLHNLSYNPVGEVITYASVSGESDDQTMHNNINWQESHDYICRKYNTDIIKINTEWVKTHKKDIHNIMSKEINWYPFFFNKNETTRQPGISIIAPVYNVAPYIRASLDSILSQSYTDFELLLIDDGSTDNSGKICDEYAKKDNRIKVFHKQNGGVNTAREFGLKIAEGKYINFIDPDDTFPPSAYQRMYETAERENADIVIGGQFVTFSDFNLKQLDDMTWECDKKFTKAYHWTDLDYVNLFLNYWCMVVGSKIYKKELWENIDIPSHLKMGEDQVFVKKVVMKSKRIINIPYYVYLYKRRKNSATTKRRTTAFDIFESTARINKTFEEFNLYDQYYSQLMLFDFQMYYLHMRRFCPFFKWLTFSKKIKKFVDEINWVNFRSISGYEDDFTRMKKLKKNGLIGFLLSELKFAYYEFHNTPKEKEISKIEKNLKTFFYPFYCFLKWGISGLLVFIFLIKLIIRSLSIRINLLFK